MNHYKKNWGEKQDGVADLVKKGEISTTMRLTDGEKIGMIIQEKICTLPIFYRRIRERKIPMSLLKCPKCGEMFSDSYRECPFCLEDEEFYHGKKPKNPGRRVEKHKSPSILGPAMILVVLLLVGFIGYGFFAGDFAQWFQREEKPPVVDNQDQQDDPVVDDPVVVDPVVIALDKTDLALTAGETASLTASGAEGITWASSDAAIVTVDENGNITAVDAGSATITASADGASSAVCVVTVKASSKPLTLQSIYGSSGDISISYGQSVPMEVIGTDAPISWSVEDGSVLVVTEDGVITGVGGGNTNVVAKVEGQTLTCIVRVG